MERAGSPDRGIPLAGVAILISGVWRSALQSLSNEIGDFRIHGADCDVAHP